MNAGAESDSLRVMAATMDRVAAQIHDVAASARMQAAAGWQSPAATAFRDHLNEVAAAIGNCALGAEQAASAIRNHADQCLAASQQIRGRIS
jgi:methyl-accepting chemotaxis protein